MNDKEQELIDNLASSISSLPKYIREMGVQQVAFVLALYLVDKYKLEDELIPICKQYIKNND